MRETNSRYEVRAINKNLDMCLYHKILTVAALVGVHSYYFSVLVKVKTCVLLIHVNVYSLSFFVSISLSSVRGSEELLKSITKEITWANRNKEQHPKGAKQDPK